MIRTEPSRDGHDERVYHGDLLVGWVFVRITGAWEAQYCDGRIVRSGTRRWTRERALIALIAHHAREVAP